MEYPTLFTAGTRWLAPRGVTTPEGVTVHEAGHQFWYGMVGNNEFEDAWMDEGFNTFSTARAIARGLRPELPRAALLRRLRARTGVRDIALSRETDGNRLTGYRRDAKSDVPSTPSFRYFPSTGGSITYNKTALWLNTLERWIGWPTLQRIMSTHFTRWQFKHPKPDDFFDRRQRGGRTRPRAGSSTRCTGARTSSTTACRICRARATAIASAPTVVVRRYGEAIFPVEVLVTFENGEQVTEHWDGTRSLEALHLRAAGRRRCRRRSIRTACCCST